MFKGSLLHWLLKKKDNRPSKSQREGALAAKPVKEPVLWTHETDGGGLHIAVALDRPLWQKMLGSAGYIERKFELDPIGREVYAMCDGKRNVKSIIRAFASSHKVGLPEAELSVSQFLKMLSDRNLIQMKSAS
ncbi:MAG: PqqD family protein [Phycisphaerae bacterium]